MENSWVCDFFSCGTKQQQTTKNNDRNDDNDENERNNSPKTQQKQTKTNENVVHNDSNTQQSAKMGLVRWGGHGGSTHHCHHRDVISVRTDAVGCGCFCRS